MEHIVRVSQKNIEEGNPCKSRTCPVALALAEAGFIVISVTPSWISLAGYYPVRVPRMVTEFIVNYDMGRSVRPFSFTLDNLARLAPRELEVQRVLLADQGILS